MSFCNARIKKYLVEQSINMEVMELALSNQCKIRHLDILKQTLVSLNELPLSLIAESKQHFQNLLQSHFDSQKTLPPWGIFHPSRDFRDAQLRKFESEAAVRAEYRQYKGACELSIEDLILQKRELLSGNEKLKLSRWWLSHISSQVTSYLTNLGYHQSAVSDKYLDEPPKNILLVKKNLILLRRVLLSYYANTDIFKLKDLIKEVCNIVYPAIISFIQDINFMLTDLLKTDQLNDYEKLISLTKTMAADDKTKRSVIDLIKDKKYVEDMQKIEAKTAKSTRDVIPISGLVISKLCRLENECKSVLNLWEPTTYSKVEEEARTPIENAVIKCDIKGLEGLLRNGANYINEQDSNGWTILHLSCSFCFNQTRLEVCKYLLEMEEMDPLIVNNYGNIALHYLVRLPIKEHEKPLFIQVIKMMLRHSSTVFIANNRGETALHSAILASNYVAVEEILKAGADPNFGNQNGDTSLHYAVQAQSKDLLSLLLHYGALLDVKNNNGETPADVAYKLNSIDIAGVLSNYESTDDLQAEAQKRKFIREKTNKQLIESKENKALWSQKSIAVPAENIKWTKPSIPVQLLAEIASLKSPPPSLSSPPLSPTSSSSLSLSSPQVAPPLPSRELKTALRVQSMKLEPSSDLPKIPPKELKRNQSQDDSTLLHPPSSLHHKEKRENRSHKQHSTLRSSNKPLPDKPLPSLDSSFSKQSSPSHTTLPSPRQQSNLNVNVNVKSINDRSGKGRAQRKALWNKTKDSDEELSFNAGEIITVINQDASGWWMGKIGNREGIFPANYTVELPIEKEEDQSLVKPSSLKDSRGKNSTQRPLLVPSPQQQQQGTVSSSRPLPTPSVKTTPSAPLNNNNNNNNNKMSSQGRTERSATMTRRELPPPPNQTQPPARRPLPQSPGLEIAELLADFVAETETEISLQKGDVVQIIKRDEGWCLVNFNGTRGFCPESYLMQK